MRAFVLCTGRCGSMTLAHACRHISNYTSGHETRAHLLDGRRLDYPDRHIEADNRLSWFLGGLERRYGSMPVYVHLRRDPDAVAASYAKRFHLRAGIMDAYAAGIVRASRPQTPQERQAAARHYVETVTANIETFLTDKPHVIRMDIESPQEGFTQLWELLGAEGDLKAALAALKQRRNAS